MNPLDPTTPAATAVINHHLSVLRNRGACADELEEVRQELGLEFWMKGETYRATRAKPSTYMNVLARNRISSRFRSQKTLKRGGGVSTASLEQRAVCQSCPEVTEMDLHGSGDHPSREDQRDLSTDVKRVLDELPPKLRQLCFGAMRTGRFERMRTTEYKEAIAEIRRRFIEAGLPGYLVGPRCAHVAEDGHAMQGESGSEREI